MNANQARGATINKGKEGGWFVTKLLPSGKASVTGHDVEAEAHQDLVEWVRGTKANDKP